MQTVNKTLFDVVPYDPTWPEKFEQEAEIIKRTLGSEVTAVHHMGSTAIPGLSAKPIIDVLVVVQDLQKVARDYKEKMKQAGYDSMGNYTGIGEEFFVREQDGHWSRNIHILDRTNPEIGVILNFRDYLREHLDDAKAYENLKVELKQKHPDDYDLYRKEKGVFINELKKKIAVWKEGADAEINRK